MTHAILDLRAITKDFPGVRALDAVCVSFSSGEIHALLGENGAGKSTLVKILSGDYHPDGGRIILRGHEVRIASPSQARRLGIGVVYQELTLVPALSVAENIFLGGRGWLNVGLFTDRRRLWQMAEAVLTELGLDIDPRIPLRELGVAERQAVQIARSTSESAEVLILDEPTAALTDRETDRLFAILRRFRERGVCVIFITHRIREVMELCDRATVLRDGRHVGTQKVAETSVDALVSQMVGRSLTQMYPKQAASIGGEVLALKNVSAAPALKNVSVSLRTGEILGIAGLPGAGRTELARVLFGDLPYSGRIEIDGKPLHLHSPAAALRAGIGLIPIDRRRQAIITKLPVAANITLTTLGRHSRFGVLRFVLERQTAQRAMDGLMIKARSVTQLVRDLSGGNQQKVAIAKWVETKPRILVLDEPTQGIDVGAKVEIYRIVQNLSAQGLGILFISSELPELLGICDRIVVMHRGRITGEFDRKDFSQERIMLCALGQEGISSPKGSQP